MTPLRVKQSITANGLALASDSEASSGTNTTKAITPKQAKDNYGYTIIAGNSVTLGGSPTEVSINFASYTKVKEMVVNRSGTYRLTFSLKTDFWIIHCDWEDLQEWSCFRDRTNHI